MAPAVLTLWFVAVVFGAESDAVAVLFMGLLLVAAVVGERERSRQRGARRG